MGTVHTKIVTVSFVNQPKQAGGKKGTIKTKDNEIFGVWADKLANFQPGKTYEIKYEESPYNGKMYFTVTGWQEQAPPAGGGGQTNGNGSGNGGGYYRPTSPVDAERMFVCGAVNAAIQGGHLAIEGTAIEAAVNAMRQVWANTLGAPADNPPY